MTAQIALKIIGDKIALDGDNVLHVFAGNEFLTAILSPNGDLRIDMNNSTFRTFNNVKLSNVDASCSLLLVKHKTRLLIFGENAIRSAVLFKLSSSETSRARFRAILETFNKPFVDLPNTQDCVYIGLKDGRTTLVYGAPTDMAKFHRVANEVAKFDETSTPHYCGKKHELKI